MSAAVRSRLFLARWRVIDVAGRINRRVPADAVALTFDDGPHPEWTPKVLAVLAASGVPATFFCVGDNARRHPDLVRQIALEGHAVGSHSATHRIRRSPLSAALREFVAGRQAVELALQQPTALFRPPHGRLTVISAFCARARGLSTWLWTVDAADWLPGTTPEELVERFVQHTWGGDVLLMHDRVEEPVSPEAHDRSALIEALPRVIDDLRAKNLRFVRLT